MLYTVRLYYNTGLNAVNICDPSVLNSFRYKDFKNINLAQNYMLDSIKIYASFDEVKDADFCRVGDFFYTCMTPIMETDKCATIPLIPEYILSAGGIQNIDFTDGITERHHIKKEDDIFGRYDEDDPYITPSQKLEIDISNMMISAGDSEIPVCESTVDLLKLGESDDYLTADTYKDPIEGENTVTVPNPPQVSYVTGYMMEDGGKVPKSTHSANTVQFKMNSSAVQKGIARARNLGIESAIISQVGYPSSLIDLLDGTSGSIGTVKGKRVEETLDGNFKYEFATVKNKRLLYGSFTHYGLISAAGNTCEFAAEEVYEEGAEAPTIIAESDPRPDGAPYFRFKSFLGKVALGVSFFQNAIKGMQWKNVPLVYSNRSGSVLDRLSFMASRNIAAYQHDIGLNNAEDAARMGLVTGGANIGTGGLSNSFSMMQQRDVTDSATLAGGESGMLSSIAGITMGAISSLWGYSTSQNRQLQNRQQYQMARQEELRQFAISQNVVVPQITFPYNADSVRDFYGNGVFSYRYRPSQLDLEKGDKLLQMYGYRHTAKLEKSMFTNRQYFNYVRATNIAIAGNLPRWWKAGISAELAAGVRLWHVKPDIKHYEDN